MTPLEAIRAAAQRYREDAEQLRVQIKFGGGMSAFLIKDYGEAADEDDEIADGLEAAAAIVEKLA